MLNAYRHNDTQVDTLDIISHSDLKCYLILFGNAIVTINAF